jgi:hypothetical protein
MKPVADPMRRIAAGDAQAYSSARHDVMAIARQSNRRFEAEPAAIGWKRVA